MEENNVPAATMEDTASVEVADEAPVGAAPAGVAQEEVDFPAASMADTVTEPAGEDVTAPVSPVAPPASPPPQDAPPAWLNPIFSQMQQQQQSLLAIQQQSQQMWQSLAEQAQRQAQARAVAESRPKPPPPEATDADRQEYFYRLARWEQDQQVGSLRNEIYGYVQQINAMREADLKRAQEAQVAAQQATWRAQYDAYFNALSTSRETAWVNTDPDARAVFDVLYNKLSQDAGHPVDPLPLARALSQKFGLGKQAPVNPVADKLKADRSKQATRTPAVAQHGRMASRPSGKPSIETLLRKYNLG